MLIPVYPKTRRITHAGADAHPCAFNHRVMPAQVSAIQAGLARGGGWARLSLAVRRASVHEQKACAKRDQS